ncbi:Pisatin demethylase [Madurella mycetomatis]|uniref:Pisatin demethylase n=1 Tax=Madurella mycetomatis TaxID=100816 RepID=A0A175VV78_9PEZI|nr:Pisatin demethylase [Madurella mycetomatis]
MEGFGLHVTPGSLISLAVITLLTVFIKRRYFSPLSDIPGPFFASITRLWQINTLIRGDSINVFYDLHQRYGPFVRVAPNEVSVSHPEAPKQLLLTALHKDDWYRAGALPDYRFQTTLSTTNPKAKVARAKHFMQGYSTSYLLTLEGRIDATFSHLLDWMDKFSAEKQPMDLDKFFTFAAADITGELLFSKPFGFISKGYDIKRTLSRSHKIVGLGTVAGYFPWLNRLLANPFVTWTGLLPFGLIYNTAINAIAEREKNPEVQSDIMTQWLKARQEGKVTLRDVQAQTTLGVVAGTDAMSTGMQSFVYHLIRHPAAWRRCSDEVARARAQGKCNTRVVSFEDAQQLEYLQACTKESLRLFGPLGTGLPRVAATGGTKLGDRVFPQGTGLSIHPYTMMRDKNIWGDDANAFRPERWLNEDSAELDKFYMPFGLGYGTCPGINLAKIELSKLTATIVRDYVIRQVNPQQEWSYEAYFNTLPHDWPVYVEKVQ